MLSAVSCLCLGKWLRDTTGSQTCICSASTHSTPRRLREEQSPSVHPYPAGIRNPGLIPSPGTAQGMGLLCPARLWGCSGSTPVLCPNIPSLLRSFGVRTSSIGASPLPSMDLVYPVRRDFQRFPYRSHQGGGKVLFWAQFA